MDMLFRSSASDTPCFDEYALHEYAGAYGLCVSVVSVLHMHSHPIGYALHGYAVHGYAVHGYTVHGYALHGPWDTQLSWV
jgi:hypothetical protein